MYASTNTNIEPYWDLIKRIITESDIVLEVLDARMIELSRNEEVERIVKEIKRPIIFVVNKSDLVLEKDLENQVIDLRNNGEVVFVSCKNKKSIKILLHIIKKVFSEYGKREINELEIKNKKKHREAEADIIIGVLGYPNVGKSSLINAMAHKIKVKVSKKPGTTHGIHWIRINNEMKLIDSPGVIPLKKEDELRYGLIGARDVERMKNPEVVANAIIKLFIEKNKRAFERYFDIFINSNEDFYDIINKIGNRKRYLIKGGNIDENRVIDNIIRDWQNGRLKL